MRGLLLLLRHREYLLGMTQSGELEERPDIVAARRGGDPDQGMTDEPSLADSSIDQAIFWRQIYSEILTLEEGIMARVRQLIESESPEVRREVELSNLPVLTAQAHRFRERRGFWSQRITELDDRSLVAP